MDADFALSASGKHDLAKDILVPGLVLVEVDRYSQINGR